MKLAYLQCTVNLLVLHRYRRIEYAIRINLPVPFYSTYIYGIDVRADASTLSYKQRDELPTATNPMIKLYLSLTVRYISDRTKTSPLDVSVDKYSTTPVRRGLKKISGRKTDRRQIGVKLSKFTLQV